MNVRLTTSQKIFIRQGIETGRFRNEEEAVHQALSLWEERERTRTEILAAVDQAEHSLKRGEGRAITRRSMQKLSEEIKQRGRDKLLTRPNRVR